MSRDQRLDPLFQPLRINGVELANRMVLGPMAVLQPLDDGRPSDQTIAFLEARAQGGVGLVIVGGAAASQAMVDEAPYRPLLRLDVEEFLPDLRRVTDAVHRHGTPVFCEVMTRFGRMGVPSETRPIISASPRNVVQRLQYFPQGVHPPADRVTPTPVEATVEQIHEVQRDTVATALRMRRAGFDGVEIAAHMSYFLASFLSTRTNWRTDDYGGSPENRARVIVEIVDMLRADVGADYPIGLRMSANDHLDDGQGPEGFAEVAGIAAAAGLDYIALTDGGYERMDLNTPAGDAAMIDHGEPQAFRRTVNVPLLMSNINDPYRSAAAIADGHADAILLARQLLADPEYPNKVRDGRLDEVVWCDRQHECLRTLLQNVPVRCAHNPMLGFESMQSVR